MAAGITLAGAVPMQWRWSMSKSLSLRDASVLDIQSASCAGGASVVGPRLGWHSFQVLDRTLSPRMGRVWKIRKVPQW